MLVVDPSFLGRGDVGVLAVLLSAAEEKDQRRSIECEIDAVSGTEVDPRFVDAVAEWFDVGLAAGLKLGERQLNSGCGAGLQVVEPRGEGAIAIAVLVLAYLRHHQCGNI